MTIVPVSPKKTTAEDIFQISLQSSAAREKEIFIFEKEDMSALFDLDQAEKVRRSFLENKVSVKQITNKPIIPKFSENDEFINQLMTFRYVPTSIFTIEKEILVFDDIVAIYDQSEMLVIQDTDFANNQKQLFMAIWEQGQSPKLEFEYKPNHSFYKNIDFFLGDLQIIAWPDADAKIAYKNMSKTEIGDYISKVIQSNPDHIKATYIIAFMWSMDGERMLDVWMFNDNHVDDRSGPLGDVTVYKEGVKVDNLGIASGNTLLVLGYEEKLRRQAKNLKGYLTGPPPKLPLEILNNKDFFE